MLCVIIILIFPYGVRGLSPGLMKNDGELTLTECSTLRSVGSGATDVSSILGFISFFDLLQLHNTMITASKHESRFLQSFTRKSRGSVGLQRECSCAIHFHRSNLDYWSIQWSKLFGFGHLTDVEFDLPLAHCQLPSSISAESILYPNF